MMVWLVVAVPNLSAREGQQTQRAGNEEAPDALIGSWVLNVGKSAYAGPPPMSGGRSFDYTRDGLVLCVYETVNASGARSLGHWYATLDGKEYNPDFLRRSGATPNMMIALKKTDDYTIDISLKQNGRVVQTGAFKLSSDGKTLTQTLTGTNPQGQRTTNIAVFDKQE